MSLSTTQFANNIYFESCWKIQAIEGKIWSITRIVGSSSKKRFNFFIYDYQTKGWGNCNFDN
jgi:hypothetical protein